LFLNTIKFSIIILIVSLYSGCTKSIYSSSYYKAYKKTYNKISPQKIKNSPAMHRATMRSYTVMGKRYHPTLAHIGDNLHGIASWYGPNFHAKKTSNGEIYNMYAFTAAHKTLPMNTMVKVKNLENGMEVVVRVNDRGPFVKSRIIDLSNVAAHKINMVKKGTARVQLTILGFNGKIAKTKSEKKQKQTSGHYYLQVGVFSIVSSAKSLKRKFDIILDQKNIK